MKRKLLSVPLAPSAKAGAASSQALSHDAFAATSKVTEPAFVTNKTSLPADTECTAVSKQTSSGDASSAKVTPAPAKRRKLLVLRSSKDIKVQPTSTQKHGSPTAGAESVADDGPPQCKNAASSMPKVQKTHRTKPQSGTPCTLGRAVAAAVKASGVPETVDRAQLQQAEPNLAVEEVLPCGAAISESLGMKLSMPSTTDVLRQIPKPAFQGLHSPAVQRLCAPGMLKGLQAELWPQRLLATDADTDMHSIALDIASWVVGSSQHVNTAWLVQELCNLTGSSQSLKLVVPSVTAERVCRHLEEPREARR
ncbi:hypothetical protein WJX82_007339 [Trebouxia sp. C0006]